MTDQTRSLVFTGHMVDLPDRRKPRFPPHLEAAAAAAIKAKIEAAKMPELLGLASGARGGDILFHEAARGLGLRTMMVLPFAPKLFETTSVGGAPTGAWISRFRKLWDATPEMDRLVMRLPKEDESYAACNDKLIALAKARGPFRLIALWDGKGSGRTGGTDDLVRKAKSVGAAIDIVAPQDLLVTSR